MPTLPNLLVIGAMKCATTSLHHYLDLHPEISMARRRGLNAFLEDADSIESHYAGQFDDHASVRGDTSPRYTNAPLNPGVPERMAARVVDARLVYVVRDPVERMLSHYTHYVASGHEDREAEEALLDESEGADRNPYLCRSLYAMQLEPYLKLFPAARVRVVYYEDLRDRRRETLRELFAFLAVDDRFETPAFAQVHHETARKRRLSPLGRRLRRSLEPALARLSQDGAERLASAVTRPFSSPVRRPRLTGTALARLRERLRDDSRRLEELVGRPAPGWSVLR